MLSKQFFAGNFKSLFKGNGSNFKELREYNVGDDIKSIDWKTSARYAKPFVKINEEERLQKIYFLIDVSKSIEFGTSDRTIKDIIAEICFILAYSCFKNNDEVGAIFFSNKVEKIIPLSNHKNTLSIIAKELIDFKPTNSGTNYKDTLEYVNLSVKKNTVIFFISDFISDFDYEKELAIFSKKFNPIIIQINDTFEENIPKTNLIKVLDKEKQVVRYVEISDAEKIKSQILQKQLLFEKKLKQYRIKFISINTEENYILKIKTFFDKYKAYKY